MRQRWIESYEVQRRAHTWADWAQTITVGHLALAELVGYALDRLWEDEDCCNLCCGPCSSILILLVSGQLNHAVRPVAEGRAWWKPSDDPLISGEVDVEFLDRAWRRVGCHEGAP